MNDTEKLKFWDERAELSDLAGTNDFVFKKSCNFGQIVADCYWSSPQQLSIATIKDKAATALAKHFHQDAPLRLDNLKA